MEFAESREPTMREASIQPGYFATLRPPVPPSVETEDGPERLVFVLRYDEEITYLVNEGLVRPGTQPSGLK